MNEFYDIRQSQEELNEYQLRNLGPKRHLMTAVSFGRDDRSSSVFRPTTAEDYDRQMAYKLSDCKPPYLLTNVLDHHLNYYLHNGGKKEVFIKQIKYVVIPLLKNNRNKQVFVDLINEWIENMNPKSHNTSPSLNIGNINAPTQLQFQSENSTQSMQIRYSQQDVIELLKALRSDLDKLDSQTKLEFEGEIQRTTKQLDANKDIKGRLLVLGEMIKDIGINVFANLVASPVFEIIRPSLGL